MTQEYTVEVLIGADVQIAAEATGLPGPVGPAGPGGVSSVVAGDGVAVDDTDPQNPVVSVPDLAGKQPIHANLTAESGLTGVADTLSYYTGAGAKALTALTAFARTLLGSADAAAVKTALSLTKSDVGLGSVDNTSDADKPVSTAQASADSAVYSASVQRSNHTGTQLAATISDLAAAVRATLLDGFTAGANTALAATDTVLEAFAKLQGQVSARVVANAGIAGATKTKVTYDAKGLVTAGADATTADIAPSTGRNYLTDQQQTDLGSMMLGVTGVITGGAVTINADPTKIDVTAGTGCFIDWTTPSAPRFYPVSWAAVTGLAVPVGSGSFSFVEVTDAGHTGTGTIVVTANKSVSAQARRNTIRLALVSHAGLTAVTSISRQQAPAWQTLDSLIDYVQAAGNINTGNTASAASNNLTIAKAAGTTTGLFLNYGNNPHAPSTVTNAAASPVSFVTSRRNGSGGFVYSALTTTISPDVYDTGAASLTAVANNKYTIQRIYFGGASDVYTITYGQAEYSSIAAAEAAIFSESPVINPQITASARFVTALIVKKGTTDLSNVSDAKFVHITQQGAGGVTVLSTGDQLVSVDMTAGDVTLSADNSLKNTIVLTNTGDGTQAIRVLTLTASASNPTQYTIINRGTQPVRITVGSGAEQVVFRRAVLMYEHGTGFTYIDDESVMVASAPFGVQKPASAGEQLIGSIQLPRGALKANGDSVELNFVLTKGGVSSTENTNIEIGTTRGTTTTNVFAVAGMVSTNDNYYGTVVIYRTSATTVKLGTLPAWYVPYTISANESTDITVPSLDSNDLFINFTAVTSSGSPETVDCRRMMARLFRG